MKNKKIEVESMLWMTTEGETKDYQGFKLRIRVLQNLPTPYNAEIYNNETLIDGVLATTLKGMWQAIQEMINKHKSCLQ